MTILGRGDLSPPRRHRRSRAPLVAAIVVALLLAAGGYAGWRAWHGSGKAAVAVPRTCVTPTPGPTPAATADFVVTVLNSTPRQGLAHQVATALRLRGFRVGHVGNTTPPVAGTAVVDYGPSLQGAARTVAEQVPGATVTALARPGVTLVLGSAFQRLAAPAAASAARASDVAAASPKPARCSGP